MMSDGVTSTRGWSQHLYDMLVWMQEHGSSVVLNYGEDTEQWEASWIRDGQRHVAVRRDPAEAIADVFLRGEDR